MIDWLNSNAGFAQSVAAILIFLANALLVGVTLKYVYYTKRVVEAASEPAISPSLYPRTANLIWLRIANYGTGPAKDVRVRIRFAGNAAAKIMWTSPLMAPGESQYFKFPSPENGPPASSIEEIRKLREMAFVATYRALDGRKLCTKHRVDLDADLRSATEAQMLVTEDHPERISISIRDEIRQLAKAVRELGRVHKPQS